MNNNNSKETVVSNNITLKIREPSIDIQKLDHPRAQFSSLIRVMSRGKVSIKSKSNPLNKFLTSNNK